MDPCGALGLWQHELPDHLIGNHEMGMALCEKSKI